MKKTLGTAHVKSSDETLRRMGRIDDEVKEIKNVFNRHLEIYAQNGKEMAGLKNEVKNLCNNFKELKDIIKESYGNNSNRISKLENWRWYIIGGATILVIVAGFVFKIIDRNFDYRVQRMIQTELDNKEISDYLAEIKEQ